MTPRERKPPPLTREEGCLLDGVLPASEAARLERRIEADPARADALVTDRRALALWREDARQGGAAPDALATRVLACMGGRREQGGAAVPTWYAVAALVLICVGVLGTAAVHARTAVPRPAPDAAASLEASLLESVVDEQLMFPGDFGLGAREAGRAGARGR